jgi:hypothetical protein
MEDNLNYLQIAVCCKCEVCQVNPLPPLPPVFDGGGGGQLEAIRLSGQQMGKTAVAANAHRTRSLAKIQYKSIKYKVCAREKDDDI